MFVSSVLQNILFLLCVTSYFPSTNFKWFFEQNFDIENLSQIFESMAYSYNFPS